MVLSFQPWVVLAAAAAASAILSFPVRQGLVRFGIVDRPNNRSSHLQVTARGGGLTVAALLLLTLAIQGEDLLAAALLLLAAVSFWDDCRPLTARVRFGVHLLAAGAVVARFLSATGIPAAPSVILLLLFCGFVAGLTNAFNFMDGINGLATGQAAISALGAAWLGHLTGLPWTHPGVIFGLAISGAALGFLPHNFPRARVFLGDVGSAGLGFSLAVVLIWLSRDAGWELLPPLLLLQANFILDTTLTLARRIMRGDRWHEAHREHFYQRLVRSGKTHAFVTGLELILQGVVLAMMVAYVFASPAVRLALAALTVGLWLNFFRYAENRFILSSR